MKNAMGHGRDATPVMLRLWKFVDRNGPVVEGMESNCWVWTGSLRNGYGRASISNRLVGAHRVTLEDALRRPLAPGMEACHRCDNRACVRPDHLFEGTRSENVLDAARKGRLPRAGGRNGRAKLTEEEVRAIRWLDAESGFSRLAIGRIFGVTSPMVQRIAERKAWTCVT